MKHSMETFLLTVGLLILTLMLSGAINAADGSESGMEEIKVEGIPNPPVILSIREYKSDRSKADKADFLTEGIPHPATVQLPQNFIGDLVWLSSEKMMAEENVILPSLKMEQVLADI